VAQAARWAPVNKDFWKLAYFLMTHSKVFHVLHLNKCSPGWERKRSLVDDILPLMKEIRSVLAEGRWFKMPIRRAWITTNGGLRPLGVPKEAHRIIGSMLGNLLEFYLQSTIKFNHGYQCGKGSGTAWRHILETVIKYPYIYELDLEGFFNNLNHRTLVDVMKVIGLPSWLWLSILEMQKSLPSNLHNVLELEQRHERPTLQADTVPGSKKVLGYTTEQNPRGVAQGHNLSPLISILVLEYALRKHYLATGVKSLFYADDGLLYHYEPFDMFVFEDHIKETGSTTAKGKCRWVRWDWTWDFKLTFLGLVYDPFKERFLANTRKGSRVVLERSIAYLTDLGGTIRTVGGMFVSPEPYKLGQSVTVSRLQWQYLRSVIPISIGVALAAIIYNDYSSFFHCLLVLYIIVKLRRLYMEYSSVPIPFKVFARVKLKRWLLNLFSWLTSPWWRAQVFMLTWRLVLKSGHLNQFIARMYNKSLEDVEIVQDFKLRYSHDSILGKVDKEWFENDLESELTVFNSSTVGTHMLIEMLTDVTEVVSTSALKKQLLGRLHATGYYNIGYKDSTGMKEFRPVEISPMSDMLEWPTLQARYVARLLPILDWADALSDRRASFLRGDRHQHAMFWPEQGDRIPVMRLYKTYHVNLHWWDQVFEIIHPTVGQDVFLRFLAMSPMIVSRMARGGAVPGVGIFSGYGYAPALTPQDALIGIRPSLGFRPVRSRRMRIPNMNPAIVDRSIVSVHTTLPSVYRQTRGPEAKRYWPLFPVGTYPGAGTSPYRR